MAIMADVAAGAAPIVLENDAVALRFDPAGGAWTGWLDKRSGRELVKAPGPGVPADMVSWLEPRLVQAALRDGRAVSLEGTWLYTREPKAEAHERLAAPDFDDAGWTPTPVPSVPEAGDRRLKDQIGAFWYRTRVELPGAWKGRDLALILGAVDDFDATYFNGRRIGSVEEGTPRHWEIPRRYVIPSSLARFDGPNVLAIRVINAAYSGGIAGPVCIGPLDELPGPQTGTQLVAHERSADGRSLTLTLRSGPLHISAVYALHGDAALISRRFTVENIEGRRRILRGAACASPDLRIGDDDALIFPDALPVGDRAVENVPPGAAVRPSSQDGLVYLWSAAAKGGLGAWLYSEDEYAPVTAVRAEAGTRLIHNQGILAPLEPRRSESLGRQFFWLAHGSRDDVLRSVGAVFRAVGLQAPPGGLEKLRERVLYCGHPGGMPERQYRGYGGFKALREYVPTLKTMGVDVLWLLPIFEHGDGTKWNLYSPFDHFRISPLYGTPEELGELARAARAAGIELMFDLVPHGPPDHTPLGKAHPEWVCLDEAGKPTYVWSQLAFDNAHPGWRDYMGRVAEHHARTFGIVGARVDVAAGSPPNWNPATGYRPSHSTLGGGLAMNRAIREGLLAGRTSAGKGVILLPEEYTGCRVFYRDADLTYDAQLFFLMVELQEKKASPRAWAESLQRFLHDQSLTLPPGAIKMRWTANHDTVSWTFQKRRTRAAYGFERARALLALCCLIDGVPMIYQGEEDPALYGGQGESIVADVARLIACRRRLPALARGTADYGAVAASDGVFACLRTEGPQQAVVLVSLNPASVRTRLTLPPALVSVRHWKDELNGEALPSGEIPMAGHGVRVLCP
ncbi:MAG: hypothetical protein HRF43_15310 [Phycisphaerae bacterium]|jgi:hypothetical protein